MASYRKYQEMRDGALGAFIFGLVGVYVGVWFGPVGFLIGLAGMVTAAHLGRKALNLRLDLEHDDYPPDRKRIGR